MKSSWNVPNQEYEVIYIPHIAAIAAFFVAASAMSTIQTSLIATEGERTLSVLFYALLGLAAVLGAAFLFDGVRRERTSSVWAAAVAALIVLPVVAIMAGHSSASDFLQISTLLQRGETKLEQVEKAETREDDSIEAAKELVETTRLAVPDESTLAPLREAVATREANVARQQRLVSEEEQNGGCKKRCEDKKKILANMQVDLEQAQARLREAEQKREAAIAAATAAARDYQSLLRGGATAASNGDAKEGEEGGDAVPTGPIKGGIERDFRSDYQKAIDEYLPATFWGFDMRIVLAALATIALNAGAVVIPSYAWYKQKIGEDLDRPLTLADLQKHAHLVQMMQAMHGAGSGQISWNSSVTAGQPAEPSARSRCREGRECCRP